MSADKKAERRGLGRGLSALMADVNIGTPENADQAPAERATSADLRVPIETVRPNPDQPRRVFPQEDLDSLAESIREKGVLQPLIVRKDPDDSEMYQIVAGERRWRASQLAQQHDIPVLVRDLSDTESLEVAIIENIQRADLNPVEEAQGYRQLMDRFGHTQERLAQALGKSRSHIANMLRLMSLPEDVLDFLAAGDLTIGHARALITADTPSALAREIIQKGLSVRDAERLAKGVTAKPPTAKKPASGKLEKDADTRALELDLGANLGMSVSIDHKPNGESGALTIKYGSLDELDDLCRRLGG
ncbi:ParB/RepB/Spo0J family partition protein [Dinoroseobacter sp. S375]|uniref:ParB/RepB/Spo0J family partition protein n=1 Tax=Dinoroseobacter sp. S375 TaxID=3415136 RepID=UPI003C797C7F